MVIEGELCKPYCPTPMKEVLKKSGDALVPKKKDKSLQRRQQLIAIEPLKCIYKRERTFQISVLILNTSSDDELAS